MSPQRTLITGVGGFTGRQLAALLRSTGAVLAGLGLGATARAPVDRYFACDLTDARAIGQVVDDFRPHAVYHLAACSATATAADQQAIIVGGFRNLHAALASYAARAGRPVRLLTIGSAAELGPAGVARLPADEAAPCEPATPYGRAKAQITAQIQTLAGDDLLQTIVARTFNLVGPGMSEQLSLGRFAAQIAAVRRGEADRLCCGTLEHRRDFTDVRDAAQAYVAILAHGRAGQIYNVCSGRSHSMNELLTRMLALAGVRTTIECEPLPPRAGDVPDVFGDPTKTWSECGWRAATPLDCSLQDLLSAVLDRNLGDPSAAMPRARSA